jgi:flagellar export protein FliJ
MRKYHFGLNSVMRLRKMEEEQARSFLLESQTDVDHATAELDSRLAAIGSARPHPGRSLGPEFAEERDQLERHAIAVIAARSAEANALSIMRTARSEWEDAARRVRSLERLNERHHETWLLESTRRAQVVTDEIAQTHRRRGLEQ